MFISQLTNRFALGFCVFAATACSHRPADTIQAFADAVNDADAAKASSMYTSVVAKEYGALLPMVLIEEASKIKARGGYKNVVILKEEVAGDTAHVVATLAMGNGSVDTMRTALVRAHGQWKFNR